MSRAVVIGATGLVGSALVAQLLADQSIEQLVTLGRRATGREAPRLQEHVVDFERPQDWAALVRGDVLYSALGTTIAAAGSREAQYRVDHDYQLAAARAAREGGVPTLVLISAMGSDPRSRIFYSRMKGELEEHVRELGFPRLRVLRPGLLDGERTEKRRGEGWALRLARWLPAWEGLAALRPVPATTVARAAIRVTGDPTLGVRVYDAAELFEWGAAQDVRAPES